MSIISLLNLYYLQYHEHQCHQNDSILARTWLFNKKRIDKICEQYLEQTLNLQRQCVYQVYQTYIKHKFKNSYKKYSFYQFIQYLLSLSKTQFEQKFGDNINSIIKFILNDYISDYQQLQIRSTVAQHLEESVLYVKMSNNLQLNNISNEVLLKLFLNVNNRLQYIYTTDNSLVIHRVEDNRIFKHNERDDKERIPSPKEKNTQYSETESLDNIFKEHSNSCVYDIVITSEAECLNQLENIKIRYLNYLNTYSQSQRQAITLQHPKYLISASLSKIYIQNIGECINLRNLYSMWNRYKEQDIQCLTNIKRLHSWDDMFDGSKSMIDILFQSNQFEYIYVENYNQQNNIVNNMVLSKNIQNLRFLYIYQRNMKFCIKLDLCKEFPENMRVYNIQMDVYQEEEQDIIYGQLEGGEDLVKKFVNQLVHSLPNIQFNE